ncbi:MAG: hypothetical protein U0T83_10060 [Bacteriovoracaceae bacterium]
MEKTEFLLAEQAQMFDHWFQLHLFLGVSKNGYVVLTVDRKIDSVELKYTFKSINVKEINLESIAVDEFSGVIHPRI